MVIEMVIILLQEMLNVYRKGYWVSFELEKDIEYFSKLKC